MNYKLTIYKSRVEEYQIEIKPEDITLVSNMDEDEAYNYIVGKYYTGAEVPDSWYQDINHMELEKED